jgi:hypothetical protein
MTTQQYILLAHMPKDTDLPEFKLGEVGSCEWHIYSEKELPWAMKKKAYYETLFRNVQLRSCSDILETAEVASV